MIERTPTEVSNRSSDDETQPKPKDTKNNEKKGTYLTRMYLTCLFCHLSVFKGFGTT